MDYKRGNRFVRFMKRNSFYIVLGVTVFAFITAGATLYRAGGDLKNGVSVNEPSGSMLANAPEQTQEPTPSPSPKPTPTLAPTQAPEENTNAPANIPFTMERPVSGEVIIAYSADSLTYSQTMDDYRAHKGIDIKADLSAPVKAAADGVVESVKNDGSMGITIVVDHQNGIKTVYSNLSTDSMVKKGDKVAKGQAISGIGDTAQTEAALAPHLHFEVLQNGKHVDPLEAISF